MKHPLCVAVLLLAAAAARAQVAFGPELAAAAPEAETPIAWTAAAASSTSGSLVVFQPMFRATTYAQLLDRNGQPLTPHGIPLTARSIELGGVASDGNGYLVAWSESKEVWTIAVSAAGAVSPPRRAASALTSITAVRIASNGGGYLVTWIAVENNRAQVRGRALDAAGAPLGSEIAFSDARDATPYTPRFADDAVASDGRDYLVVFVDGKPRGAPFDAPVTFVPVIGGVPGTAKTTALPLQTLAHSFIGPSYMLACYDDANTYIASVGADGTVAPRRLLGNGEIQSMAGTASGAVAIVVQRSASSGEGLGVFAFRLTKDALPIDRRKIGPLGSNYTAGATAAGDVFAVTLAWERMNFALLPPGGIDPAPPLDFRPLAQFATTQQSPAMVRNGDVDVLAWVEASSVRVTRLRDGVPLDAPPLRLPANTDSVILASGGGRTFIAWSEPARTRGPTSWGDGRCRFLGAFLSADGTLSPPFTFATPDCSFDVDSYLSTAVWSGSGFVVLWIADLRGGVESRFWRTRVDLNGNVTTPAGPLDLAVTPGGHVGQWEPACVPTAGGFLLLYMEMIDVPVGKYTRRDLFAASFAGDASAIGSRQPVAASIDVEEDCSLASDGRGHFLATFRVAPAAGGPLSLWAMPLDERGNPTAAATLLRGSSFDAAVSWTGSAFLVLTTNEAALLDVDGRIVAPLAPLSISLPYSRAVGEGAIAYSRSVVDAELGDVDRVFVRRIIPPRRRAARP
jgi:hypothetical protein